MNRDTALFVGYAVANAGLTIAGAHGLMSGADVTEVAGVLTAFAVAFHIPNAKAAAALKAQAEPAPVVEDAGVDALLAGRAES